MSANDGVERWGPTTRSCTPRLQIELHAELVVVSNDHRWSHLDRPGRGASAPGQKVDQGRLSGSVRSDDAQPLTAVENEINVGEDEGSVAVTEGNPRALDHLVAQTGGIAWSLQFGRAHRRHRDTLDQLFGGIDPGLRLARTRLRTTPEPRQLVPGQVPPGRFGCCGVIFAFGFGFEIRPVTALVHVGPPAVELQHSGGDAIEQMAVVRDQHQAAPEGEEALLEPRHRAQIEVVGRLIEHQEFRRMRQHPGQCHPFGLAARQRPDVFVDGRAHAETLQRRLGFPPLSDGFVDAARRQFRRLRQETHPGAPPPEHLAFFWEISSGDDP